MFCKVWATNACQFTDKPPTGIGPTDQAFFGTIWDNCHFKLAHVFTFWVDNEALDWASLQLPVYKVIQGLQK